MRHLLLAGLLGSAVVHADVAAPSSAAPHDDVAVLAVPASGALRYVIDFHASSYEGCGQAGRATSRRGTVAMVATSADAVTLTLDEQVSSTSWSRGAPRRPAEEARHRDAWPGRAKRLGGRLTVELEGGLRLTCGPRLVSVDGAAVSLLACETTLGARAPTDERLQRLRDALVDRACTSREPPDECRDGDLLRPPPTDLLLGARPGVRIERSRFASALVTRKQPG